VQSQRALQTIMNSVTVFAARKWISCCCCDAAWEYFGALVVVVL
jgi:hypothetical protein